MSFGIAAFSGYIEMIAKSTRLPCTRKEVMENALDYPDAARFGIAVQRSVIGPHVVISTRDVELKPIPRAKSGSMHVQVVMTLEKDLTGSLQVRSTVDSSSTSMAFDGKGYSS